MVIHKLLDLVSGVAEWVERLEEVLVRCCLWGGQMGRL